MLTSGRVKHHYEHGSAAGGRDPLSPWIFKHGTNIVDRGLNVLFFGLFLPFFVFFPIFFGLFFRAPPPLEEANSAIFRYFFANFRSFFSLPLLENFLPTLLITTFIFDEFVLTRI